MVNSWRRMNRWLSIAVILFAGLAGCEKPKPKPDGASGGAAGAKSGEKQVHVAFVTNNISPFWQIAESGVRKAEKEFNAKCEFRMPDQNNLQPNIVEDLISKGVSGIAISPLNSENQTEMLNNVVDKGINLICHDSDAPNSKRICFVGTDNVQAGRAAGELIIECLPEGGKIMLFVGSMDAQNARERKQGIEEAIKGTKIEIIDVRTDNKDDARAKQNVEDTLSKYPDIACLVGLWSYNAPQILHAVKDGNKSGKVKIVAFDEEEETLQGIRDGHIYGTVVQAPYYFGYDSVRILAGLARGDKSVLPKDGRLIIPVVKVKKDSVDEFQTKLKELLTPMK